MVGCELVDAARYLLLTCGHPVYAARYLLLSCGDPVCAARHLLLTGGNTGGDPVDALPHRVEIDQYCVGLLQIGRRGG